MHSIVTTFRGAVIKVEVANFCAAMDTLIDQDVVVLDNVSLVQATYVHANLVNWRRLTSHTKPSPFVLTNKICLNQL